MKRLSSDKGSALVEFALILPAFLMIVLGSLTFVWLLAARSAVTGATRDGARYASIQHDWLDCPLLSPCDTTYPSATQVSTYVNQRAGIFGGHIDVAVDPTAQPERNQVITVTSSRTLPAIFGPIAAIFGVDHITYSSSAVTRAE